MEEKSQKNNFTSFSEVFKNKKPLVKPPAYPWQELALRIIKELSIPNFKRSSVFKVCRDLPSTVVERAFNDTKELCQTGLAWKYFFKIIDASKKDINK
jgi:hypothetical protein